MNHNKPIKIFSPVQTIVQKGNFMSNKSFQKVLEEDDEA